MSGFGDFQGFGAHRGFGGEPHGFQRSSSIQNAFGFNENKDPFVSMDWKSFNQAGIVVTILPPDFQKSMEEEQKLYENRIYSLLITEKSEAQALQNSPHVHVSQRSVSGQLYWEVCVSASKAKNLAQFMKKELIRIPPRANESEASERDLLKFNTNHKFTLETTHFFS
jgi:hypothetical protein